MPSLIWRLADDAARRQVLLAGWAVSGALDPSIRSDRVPSRFDAGERAETGDELAIGQQWRRFAADVAMAAVVPVALRELSRQAFVDRPRTEDQQVVHG
jgi:hypothetical protein